MRDGCGEENRNPLLLSAKGLLSNCMFFTRSGLLHSQGPVSREPWLRVRKVSGTFEKRAPGPSWRKGEERRE